MPRLRIVTGCLTTVEGYSPVEEFFPDLGGRDPTEEEIARLSERLARLGPEKNFDLVGGALTPEAVREKAGPHGAGPVLLQILNRNEEEARISARRIRDMIFFGDF